MCVLRSGTERSSFPIQGKWDISICSIIGTHHNCIMGVNLQATVFLVGEKLCRIIKPHSTQERSTEILTTPS